MEKKKKSEIYQNTWISAKLKFYYSQIQSKKYWYKAATQVEEVMQDCCNMIYFQQSERWKNFLERFSVPILESACIGTCIILTEF